MNKDSKLKFVPLLVTLIAASITVVINIIMQVDFGVFVKRLFFSVIIFLVVGYVAMIILSLSLKNEKDVGILESEAEESSEDGENSESSDEEEEDEEE